MHLKYQSLKARTLLFTIIYNLYQHCQLTKILRLGKIIATPRKSRLIRIEMLILNITNSRNNPRRYDSNLVNQAEKHDAQEQPNRNIR